MILLLRGLRTAPNLRPRRIVAIARKEIREYRRNRSVLWAMGVFPAVFLLQPLVAVFLAPASASGALRHGHELLYMLGIPILVPATLASYAVAGERQQGSLEPVLTTPITREEFLLGKALAVLIPSLGIAYAVYAFFLAAVALFAAPGVASAILQVPDILVQVVFTPLLAGWAIWIGLGISTRFADVRVAQQVSLLGSLPLLIGTSLLAFGAIDTSRQLILVAGIVLLAGDVQGWRIVAPLFDRERLITGTRA
jgi:ABC-type transport system involved in multi-copper enzyme maturation permease subunit